MEASHDTKVLTPVDLLDQEARNKWAQVRSHQEAESPEIDLSSPLVEEKHVVNDGEANDLWRGIEESLESTTCCKASVGWR